MTQAALIEKINQLLPQTQCGLCSYAGCKPYATAMVKQGEAIDRCLPGGVNTLQTLGQVLKVDASPYLANMQAKQKPAQMVKIREDECIGCTKCIQACPVDAIIGAGKQMHTVIASECTGCELCIAPCPVDCIDLIALTENTYDKSKAQQRYAAKQRRGELAPETKSQHNADIVATPTPQDVSVATTDMVSTAHADILAKRDYIALAVARAQSKKQSKQTRDPSHDA